MEIYQREWDTATELMMTAYEPQHSIPGEVSADTNAAAMERAFTRSGHRDHTLRSVEGPPA